MKKLEPKIYINRNWQHRFLIAPLVVALFMATCLLIFVFASGGYYSLGFTAFWLYLVGGDLMLPVFVAVVFYLFPAFLLLTSAILAYKNLIFPARLEFDKKALDLEYSTIWFRKRSWELKIAEIESVVEKIGPMDYEMWINTKSKNYRIPFELFQAPGRSAQILQDFASVGVKVESSGSARFLLRFFHTTTSILGIVALVWVFAALGTVILYYPVFDLIFSMLREEMQEGAGLL